VAYKDTLIKFGFKEISPGHFTLDQYHVEIEANYIQGYVSSEVSGKDFADGPLNNKTFLKIMTDIIKWELDHG
jgi:hypothetical protein